MKERPILFKGAMVRAILDGTKTQTRRIVNPQPDENGISCMPNAPLDWSDDVHGEWNPWKGETPNGDAWRGRVVCWPGDRLWVRETWQDWCPIWQGAWCGCGSKEMAQSTHRPAYAATPDERGHPAKWRPSIFMPRWASRITLEVVSVRVERLNDCSRGDAMAEGCPFPNMADGPNPRKWYSELWESINGPGSWAANPWVWVVEFRKINTP